MAVPAAQAKRHSLGEHSGHTHTVCGGHVAVPAAERKIIQTLMCEHGGHVVVPAAKATENGFVSMGCYIPVPAGKDSDSCVVGAMNTVLGGTSLLQLHRQGNVACQP